MHGQAVRDSGVLVTGGAGYIGSHTCKLLAEAGYEPVVFDNLTLGHRSAVRWGPLVTADLIDTSAVVGALRQYKIAAVVHFAASAYVGDSVRDPAAYYRNNLLTTLSLLDALRTSGIGTLIFSSSCSVYGNPVRTPIDEQHPTAPLSPYGQTKLDGENAIRWYGAAYGIRSVSLRYFNAAGADPDGETGEDHNPETRLIPRAILAAQGKEPALEVFGDDYATADGTAVRDYIHVTDLAAAHVQALRYLTDGGEPRIFNLGTGRGYSVRQVIDTVTEIGTRPVPYLMGPRRAGDPACVVADAALANRVLGWTPRHSSLDTIVKTAWQWHQRHERP